MGLQRSEQLRELYGSLSFGDSNHQMKRPSALLSPEDLTDMEWYYVVCMSFTYRPGEWFRGHCLTDERITWNLKKTNWKFALWSSNTRPPLLVDWQLLETQLLTSHRLLQRGVQRSSSPTWTPESWTNDDLGDLAG